MRLFLPGALGLVMFCVWVYAVFDVIATDNALVRNLPKMTWLLIVLFIPTVGAVAWLALGRPMYAGFSPGDTRTRNGPRGSWYTLDDGPTKRRPLGPEDTDDWNLVSAEKKRAEAIEARRLAEWEADLERREKALDGDADESDDEDS